MAKYKRVEMTRDDKLEIRTDSEIAECIDRKVSSDICKIITKYFPGWSPKEDMVLKLARKIIEEEKENAGD